MQQSPSVSAQPVQCIRIVAIPPGEAPLWVREKWLGLELPIADGKHAPQQSYISGVLSGPRYRFFAIVRRLLGRLEQQTGYPVYVADALGVLQKTAPDAAAWWRVNVPRLQRPNRKFLFRTAFCELAGADATPRTTAEVLPQTGAVQRHGATTSPVPHIAMPGSAMPGSGISPANAPAN